MLVNAPLMDQRTQRGLPPPAGDGAAPENGDQDCVPTAFASLAQALTGTAYAGDTLHDAVYGQGSVGLEDPARYAAYFNAHPALGIAVSFFNDPEIGVVLNRVLLSLHQGAGVIVSIPSDWDRSPEPISTFAHMVAACDLSADNTQLTAMNPWGGFYQTHFMSWWQDRMARCSYKGIWIVSRRAVVGNFTADPANPGWFTDDRTKERIFQGFLDALVRDNEDRPVIRGVRLLPNGQDSTIIVGDYASGGNAVYLFDHIHLAATRDYPGNALRDTESALDAARAAVTKASASISQLQQQVSALQAQLQATQGAAGSPQDQSLAAAARAFLGALSALQAQS